MRSFVHKTERPQKEANYRLLFDGLSHSESVLLMPSSSCGDVRYLLAHGMISHSSQLHVVEEDRDIYPRMISELRSLGFHEGVNLTPHLSTLVDYVPPTRFDLIFIDLLGSILKNIADWMQNVLSRSLVSDSRMCLTVNTSARNNPHLVAFQQALKRHFPQIIADRIGLDRNNYDYSPELWLRMIFHMFQFETAMWTYNDDASNAHYAKMTSFRMNRFKPSSKPMLSHSALFSLEDDTKC